MTTNYFSDKAVVNKKDDYFQRYNFAERIAQTVHEYDSPECLAVGIYGKWGEGKTSLLSFIETELKKLNSELITIYFNPWRFGDETSLLTYFFQILSSALQEKLYTKREIFAGYLKGEELKSNKKFIEDLLQYSQACISTAVSFSPLKGKINAGKTKSEISIETLKGRVEKFLIKHSKRIVVVVDDIDRLDAQEIRALFRLIKLTGDLSFVTYILAFDDKLVADSLAKSFGSSDISIGYSYLEKIIQVPLNVPRALKHDLDSFCRERLNLLIKDLDSEDLEKLDTALSDGIIPLASTPRMIIRFINACKFSLPLMKRLVNDIDLILIEAIKLFASDIYIFIRDNKHLFTTVSERSINSKSSHLDSHVEQLNSLLKNTDDNAGPLKHIMRQLFPETISYWGKPIFYREPNLSAIHTKKRICSADHFDRYFTYTVAKDEISDILLEDTIADLSEDVEKNVELLSELFEKYDPADILGKITGGLPNSEISKKLTIALSNLAYYFPRSINDRGYLSLPDRLARLIIGLASSQEVKSKKELLEYAVTKSTPREFGFNILTYLDKNNIEQLGLSLDMKMLQEDLLEEVIKQTPSNRLLGTLPLDARKLLLIWSFKNRSELDEYLKNLIKANPNQAINIIKAFTPYRLESGDENQIAFLNFTSSNYDQLSNHITIEPIIEALKVAYGKGLQSKDPRYIDEAFETNDDKNLAKQFINLYVESKKVKD